MTSLALKWKRTGIGELLLHQGGGLQIAGYFCPDCGDVVDARVGTVRKRFPNGSMEAWVICPVHSTVGIDELPPLPPGFRLVGNTITIEHAGADQ